MTDLSLTAFGLLWSSIFSCCRCRLSSAFCVFWYICSSCEGTSLLWFGSCNFKNYPINMDSFIINPKTYRSAQKGRWDSFSLPTILPRPVHCLSPGLLARHTGTGLIWIHPKSLIYGGLLVIIAWENIFFIVLAWGCRTVLQLELTGFHCIFLVVIKSALCLIESFHY